MKRFAQDSHRADRTFARHDSPEAVPALEMLEPRLLLSGDLWISEFAAVNDSTFVDADGDSSDWVEIYNASDAAIDLDGYHLTDKADNLDNWTFPSVTIPAGGYLVVFASGKDRTDPAGELHTDFSLSGSGEYLALVQPDGATIEFEYAPSYPPQTGEATYGVLVPGYETFFTIATPGQANYAPSAEAAQYSVEGGTFASSFQVTLSADSPTAVIHYTTNGSTPTSSSPVYTGPITISSTTRLQTLVTDTGLLDGPVTSETYIRLASDVANFNSNLPLVVIDSYNQSFGETNYTFTSAAFIEVDEVTGRAALTDPVEYVGNSGMRIRGNSSTQFPKKQFKVEIYGDELDDTPSDYSDGIYQEQNVSLFGMPAESDWVLYAPYSDKTMMRNYLTYLWSAEMGNYSIRTQFCEVFLNEDGDSSVGYEDYVGVYILMENIKIDDDRVPAEPMDDNPVSPSVRGDEVAYQGGFIIEKETSSARLPAPGDYFNPLKRSSDNWVYRDPDYDEITQAQKDYVRAKIDRFENVLWNSAGVQWNDPDEGYAKYIDVDAFIDFELLQQLANNNDAWYSSAHVYLNAEDQLVTGPVWDFNITYGNVNYGAFGSPEGWQAIRTWGWWDKLFADSNFEQAWIDRWGELREGLLSEDAIMAEIDATASLLGEAQARDQARWNTLGEYVWPNPDGYESRTTYQDEVDWLKDWISDRLAWIDSQYPASVSYSQAGVAVDPGSSVFLDAPAGTIYYTLDGSDPRLSGGGVASGAIQYVPGFVTQTTLVTAGSVWKYLDNGTNQGTAWRSPSFNDSSWAAGPAQLGYDEGDEATLVSYGPDPSNKYTTTYFRHTFSVSDTSQYQELIVRLLRDDGAVVYLNGVEVVRSNMPSGTISYDTLATTYAGGSAEDTFYEFVGIDPALLVQGDNVLAVEIHQSSVTSSDISFDLALVAEVPTQTAGGVVIDGNTEIIARAYTGAYWSAPTSATFATTELSQIAVSEINYNPYEPTAAEIAAGFTDADAFEFIELYNYGSAAVSLAGFSIADGVEFSFAPVSLDPGEYAVVVRDEAAFQMRYGQGVRVLGEYDGALNNGGETLTLTDGIGRVVASVEYNDSGSWPGRPDGKGATLELIDPAMDPADSESWRSSGLWLGSPGWVGVAAVDDVVINEILTHTDLPLVDSIELYNTTGAAIDIGGWYLSDSSGDYLKFRIPDGTVIPAGGYAVFDEYDFNPNGTGFALSGAHGDEVWLMAGDASGDLVRFVDHVEFGAATNGESFGRYPNGTGELAPMLTLTLGSTNADPRVGPVVISEVMYDPAGSDVDHLKYIEIYNPTTGDVDLTGWRIRGDADFDFADGTILPAGEAMLVLSFDPNDSANVPQLAEFFTVYEVGTSTVVGGWADDLDGDGGRVTLYRPDEPPTEEPDFTPYLLEDEVVYDNAEPWPTAAAGTGMALARTALDQWGSDPASWSAQMPSPATAPEDRLLGDANLDNAVDLADFVILKTNFGLTDATWAQGDFDGSGSVDLADFVILKTHFGETRAAAANVDLVAEQVAEPADTAVVEPAPAPVVEPASRRGGTDALVRRGDIAAADILGFEVVDVLGLAPTWMA